MKLNPDKCKFCVTSVSCVGHLLTADSIKPLQYLDVTKPIVLSADASQHGLGAVCLQQGAPVAFASRALTPTKSQYAQTYASTQCS